MSVPVLSLLETRVLGVLIEKQHTVPDSYPLSLVALTSGCNQKSSRDPVIDAAETEVQAAIDSLKHAHLVIETSGGRVMRYAHNVGRALDLPPQSVALLAVLMLLLVESWMAATGAAVASRGRDAARGAATEPPATISAG